MDLDIKQFAIRWIEQYLFFPNIFQRLIGVCFFPITILYCLVVAMKRTKAQPFDFEIPIISIGNLVIGGSGKTPITIALAKNKPNSAVVLRGYGRTSKGLYLISHNGKILEDIYTSGDEAMLLAKSLPNTTIIVSENRVDGVLKARDLGCKVIFLDDGYSQHQIKKFDILIRPKDEPTNLFCLPSGGYRETKMMYSFVPVVLKDGEDFKRVITFKQNGKIIDNLPSNIVLLTAISKAHRLLEYLPKDTKTEIFIDHYNFTKNDIVNIETKYPNHTIITTAKDMVKLDKFKIDNIILIDLEIDILLDIEKDIKKVYPTY